MEQDTDLWGTTDHLSPASVVRWVISHLGLVIHNSRVGDDRPHASLVRVSVPSCLFRLTDGKEPAGQGEKGGILHGEKENGVMEAKRQDHRSQACHRRTHTCESPKKVVRVPSYPGPGPLPSLSLSGICTMSPAPLPPRNTGQEPQQNGRCLARPCWPQLKLSCASVVHHSEMSDVPPSFPTAVPGP